jgi:hypothetical protein
MRDRIHQPYRAPICPLLPRLLPLAGEHGILGAALSGAGPSVLVIVGGEESLPEASAAIRNALKGLSEPELLVCRFEPTGQASSPCELRRRLMHCKPSSKLADNSWHILLMLVISLRVIYHSGKCYF